jgi:hypothetical protein
MRYKVEMMYGDIHVRDIIEDKTITMCFKVENAKEIVKILNKDDEDYAKAPRGVDIVS